MKTLSNVFSPLILGAFDLLTSVHVRVFFRGAIMVFDGTQTPAGVSVVHTEASPAPSSFLFLCGVTSWRSRLCDVNPWPSRALPNGFVLCSRPTWYFPKPSIYCWSPVQVINGLTELWVSVTKKGHMLWTELPKESLDRKLSHPDGSQCPKVTIIFCSNGDSFWFIAGCQWTEAWLLHTEGMFTASCRNSQH